ncbi:MAG: tRNA lysidine(34) synthetase TilS [Clostridia bacterium]|nr:tRNA lysidine(34) synthetase TilS [Clostridia bacterium]
MIERIRREIIEKGLIAPGEKVLAALSGGADSTALLLVLCALREELGFKLFAAHFNHGIRAAADEDEAFCRELCRMNGVLVFCEKQDVPQYAKENGLSLETAARLLRYEFLFRVKNSVGADMLATAHHADDSAESVLMHIIRGSGLSGLAGIREKAELSFDFGNGRESCLLIRPLLGCKKADIIAFLNEKAQPYRTDETNFSTDAARNYLRLSIIPGIEENLNGAFTDNLLRLSQIVREDDEYLLALAKEALEDARLEGGFDRKKLSALPAPVLKRCLRLALDNSSTLVDVEAVHIERLIALLKMQSGAEADIPHSRARISFSKLIIESAAGEERGLSDKEAVFPCEEGEYLTPFGRFIVSILPFSAMEKNGNVEYNYLKPEEADAFVAFMDAKKLEGSFTVRTRRPGDRFHPVNSAWRMKLKDFFISRRVDEKKRDRIPLVLSRGEIVFIPGFLVSDEVKLTAETEKVVKIQFSE